ncbi:hypothetical protein SAMN05443270_2995 [Lacrimispora sphenoides]|uniref:hypothetical protein n=1 Tax=Lacrimispora TaxID=2719231 RepID=UPI0008D2DFA9|nr:hypothetical protein [Lacrimispora sphenoides]SEU08039.1 hypothetical protein SAMN05443270_2995 [Lacrimispora sphenoides]
MKLHLYEVVNMDRAIGGLSGIKVPQEMSYWIFRNVRIIKEHCTYYETEQNKLMKEYLYKDIEGKYAKILEDGKVLPNYKSDEDHERYDESISKLGELEVEIDPYLLDYDKFVDNNPSFMLEPGYLLALDKLIKIK